MPSIFDKLVEQVAEADRTVLEKYPQFRQTFETLDTKTTEWEEWSKNNWDKEANTTKGAVELLRRKDEEIEALKMLQGEGMNWDEIKANVQSLVEQNASSKKYLTAEDLGKMPVVKQDDLKTVSEQVKNLERGMEFTYAKTAHLPVAHMQEFGTALNLGDMFKYMADNKINDFDTAYAAMVAPARKEKADAARAAELETLRKTVREETLKEVRLKGDALPVDDKGSPAERSALQVRLDARRKVEVEGAPKLTPGDIGSGVPAQDAYQAYMRDLAAGKTTVQ